MPKFKDIVYYAIIIVILKGSKMQKSEILENLKQEKSTLEKYYGITKLGLFGSYSRDEAKSNSDIDILFEVKNNTKFSMFQYLKLNQYLEDILHSKVDLVREATVKDALKEYIEKDLIYV